MYFERFSVRPIGVFLKKEFILDGVWIGTIDSSAQPGITKENFSKSRGNVWVLRLHREMPRC